ncbi:MAG TPA: GspMb/PilO family protein [Candidatus Polarisedimenticolaceae bacterium]|nr:GspMb/PilO family protein [Candidatus Polarisedimenticolaceae bacterium]
MTPVKRAPRFDIREASGIILLVAAAALVANVAATVLLVRPRLAKYHQLTDTSSPQAQLVKTREAEVVVKETHRKALEKAKADMTHLAADVLSTRQKRMIGVQLEVSELLKQFGISWDRVQYENEPLENGALERFAIVVPLEGGYSSLRRFIQAVEKSENFLVIERVQLGAGKVQDVVQLNITLATYFIAPDARLDDLGRKPAAPARES